MMAKNVVEKFREFFSSLEEEEQRDIYDILTLLRGPDDPNFTLKYLTTSRIRHMLGIHLSKFLETNLVINYDCLDDKEIRWVYDKMDNINNETGISGHFIDKVANYWKVLDRLGIKR